MTILEPYHDVKVPWQDTTLFIPKLRSNASFIGKVNNFIVLPAFNVPNDWLGASHIVAKYNYILPSKVSLLTLPARLNDTFCLAITWGDGPQRYKLWEDIGEILYVDLYSGAKVIDTEFSLEIWNVDGEANAINPGPLVIDISSLSLPDLDNLTCATLVGLDVSSYTETCDNTMTLTGFNPSTEQFSFTDPCAGVQIPL